MTINPDDWGLEPVQAGGTYAKFDQIGDEYVGRIASFTLDGGTDFNSEPCPQLVLETADGIVKVNGSQAALRRLMTDYATRLVAGHGIRITHDALYQTKAGTSGKSFVVAISPRPVPPVEMRDLTADEAPF